MTVELAQKLRLTAAVLGCGALKDLAREFRRVNAATAFDIEPAYKWLQGRSAPRSPQVYADWAALLDLGHPADWLRRCTVEMLAEAICARHSIDRASLSLAASRFGRGSIGNDGTESYLCGTYAC